MTIDYAWRRRFIDVIEEVFRELHFDPPAMTHDPEISLVMELEVDGTTFEVVHNPLANASHCLVEARVGTIATDSADHVLTDLLIKNLFMAKQYGGTFSADIKDDTVLYSVAIALEQASGSALLQAMRETAVLARDWRLMLSGNAGSQPGVMGHVSSALA